MEDDSSLLIPDDIEGREQIRGELSTLSFENLQKLKEKLGAKVYNEAVFSKRKERKFQYKRENKNRPREESARKPVSRFQTVIPVKKNFARDPRFDGLCGEFDEKNFKKSYGFLRELKENDLQALQMELNKTEDEAEIKKIKYLMKRLQNQLREEDRREKLKQKEIENGPEVVKNLKHGKKPNFKKKSEKKVLDLVSQFEELKNTGKLKKHIQRLRKKNKNNDRKKLQM